MEQRRNFNRDDRQDRRRQPTVWLSDPMGEMCNRRAYIHSKMVQSSGKIRDLLNELEKGLDRLQSLNRTQHQLLSSYETMAERRESLSP